MKIVVWSGCRVISENIYAGDGPDIHIDPVNLPESISVRRTIDGVEQSESVSLLEVARR